MVAAQNGSAQARRHAFINTITDERGEEKCSEIFMPPPCHEPCCCCHARAAAEDEVRPPDVAERASYERQPPELAGRLADDSPDDAMRPAISITSYESPDGLARRTYARPRKATLGMPTMPAC